MNTDFRFYKLGFSVRLLLVAALYILTAFLQVWATKGILAYIPVIIAWTFLLINPETNKPKDQGLEEWRPVSNKDITRIFDSIIESKKLRSRLGRSRTSGVFFMILCGILAFFASRSDTDISLLWINLGLFCAPGFFFGKVSIHIPPELDSVMPCFSAIFQVPVPTDLKLTPYLRFDKDDKGLDVPENMRCMLEPKRKPDDLIGVQFQVALNNGPNGKVPYMYAVAITRGASGISFREISAFSNKKYHVEVKKDGEYGTVVIRQTTTGGGYQTTPRNCEDLYKIVLKILLDLSV